MGADKMEGKFTAGEADGYFYGGGLVTGGVLHDESA